MKCLESRDEMIRPVGHGMIFVGSIVPTQIIPFPTGRFRCVSFPGISCLATFLQSLRDKFGK